jgi:hypothetical protein
VNKRISDLPHILRHGQIRNEYVKCVQKYPGVGRTSSYYYTTINEYFDMNYIKSDEKNNNSNVSAKNFGKLDCTVSNH